MTDQASKSVELDPTDRMIFLGGSKRSFRCMCGSNVFRQILNQPHRFVCNSCNATYTAE